MKFYSTKNKTIAVTFEEAVFKGLPSDNGLFMPHRIGKLSNEFVRNLSNFTLQEIAFEVTKCFLENAIPETDLHSIVQRAINFPAPLVQVDENSHILELFHGPSLAFKDFGARFMAEIMSYYLQNKQREIVILVATSGDTGGAVAAGFFDTPGIKVIILYPSGKVSPLQEKQLTTFGKNITALEVKGTFDDCQSLVKSAFLDTELTSKINLSSANSINIARLLPQTFYYFEAAKHFQKPDGLVFIVPSGNFGNLTAGLFAKRMGLPIHRFVAASNMNTIVSDFLNFEKYKPAPSVQTISNAMDVGNPSNFARILDLYGSTWNKIATDIYGTYVSDNYTEIIIRTFFDKTGYLLDPHAAVGFGAWKKYSKHEPNATGIILGTAHPSKFLDYIPVENKNDYIHPKLKILENKEKQSVLMDINYEVFKDWIQSHY